MAGYNAKGRVGVREVLFSHVTETCSFVSRELESLAPAIEDDGNLGNGATKIDARRL